MEIFKNVTSLFTALVGINYFYTFWAIYKLLKNIGINTFSILSVQDLIFPLAVTNIFIIVICGSFFAVIIGIWKIQKLDNQIFKGIDPISAYIEWKNIKKIRHRKKKKQATYSLLYKLINSISIILLIIWIFYFYRKGENIKFTVLYLFGCLHFSLMYFEKYYDKIIQIGVFAMIFLGWLILNESIEKPLDNTQPKTIYISRFIYENDTIRTNLDNKLVFFGSKYLVLHNYKLEKTLLFETSSISNFSHEKIFVDSIPISVSDDSTLVYHTNNANYRFISKGDPNYFLD